MEENQNKESKLLISNQNTPKGPGGRPTKYEPWMCDKIVEYMAEGMSKKAAATKLGYYGYQELKDLALRHPEFAEAIKRGESLSELWWEENGRVNLHNREFNTALWFINMKNRHKWTDRVQNETAVTFSPSEAIKQLHDEG